MNRQDSFSPSETKSWVLCPRLWYLSKRWEPAGSSLVPLLFGRAVSESLACYFRAMASGADAAQAEPPALLEGRRAMETSWVEDREWTLDGALVVLEKCLRAGMATDLLQGGSVVAVEKDFGGLRPDLVIRYATGGLGIIDHKWTQTLKPEWVEKRHEAQETDIQLWDYAMRVGDGLGESVLSTGYHTIAASPRVRTWYEPAVVVPERIALFRTDVEHWWAEMARAKLAGVVPAGRWTACLSKEESYGRCRMYDACHLCHLIPERMTGLYTRKEAR